MNPVYNSDFGEEFMCIVFAVKRMGPDMTMSCETNPRRVLALDTGV